MSLSTSLFAQLQSAAIAGALVKREAERKTAENAALEKAAREKAYAVALQLEVDRILADLVREIRYAAECDNPHVVLHSVPIREWGERPSESLLPEEYKMVVRQLHDEGVHCFWRIEENEGRRSPREWQLCVTVPRT